MNINKINRIVETPMSGKAIQKYMNGRANIVTRQEISNYNDINQILRGNDHAFIYTKVTQDSGHWEVIFCTPELSNMYFFDSYGFKPDYVVSSEGDQFGQAPVLNNLLHQYNNVFVNPNHFQVESGNVDTCGRYCCTASRVKA